MVPQLSAGQINTYNPNPWRTVIIVRHDSLNPHQKQGLPSPQSPVAGLRNRGWQLLCEMCNNQNLLASYFIKHSLGHCKSLTRLQTSKVLDSINAFSNKFFFPFSLVELIPRISYSIIFHDISLLFIIPLLILLGFLFGVKSLTDVTFFLA